MFNLHIIEPTLYDQTGHGYSYISALLQANSDRKFAITVWLDKRGKALLNKFHCTTKAFFSRKIRQLQKIFLYKNLIKEKANLFISTAEFFDIKVCNFWLKKYKYSKIFLHFHQFNLTKNKMQFLRSNSLLQDNLIFLAPTPGLIDIFVQAGIKHTHVVPCASYPPPKFKPQDDNFLFEKVIFAGAARADKGFADVINLITYCKQQNKTINFHIQTSPPNSGKYDPITIQALERLSNLKDPHFYLQPKTLAQEQYLNFFNKSICLLLYDVKQYYNKFSGVTLDALNSGCPIITASNTWMGDTVARYTAGIVVDNYNPETVLSAIEAIIQNYPQYAANAFAAAKSLEKIHNPQFTLNLIQSYL